MCKKIRRLKKLEKSSCEKSYQRKSDGRIEFFFYFYICLLKFLAYKFFGVAFFAMFSTDSKSSQNYAFLITMFTQKNIGGHINTFGKKEV
jgi:hypothetical protein